MPSLPTAAPDVFKEAMRTQWDQSATGWDAHTAQIHTWLQGATELMLDGAGVAAGQHVLDVAAGAGDQTLDIARRVGPAGRVLATDLSPAILALAQSNARREGYGHVEVLVADGEALPVDTSTFDAAVCRLGLMFFPSPIQGLREMYRAIRPGGAASTMVFSRPEKNPCVGILMSTALRHAGMPPPDPYQPGGLLSLGKPKHLDELFVEAGFRDVATTVVAAPFRMPSVKNYLEFIRASASPVRQLLGKLDPFATQAAWTEIEAQLDAFTTPGGWVGPNELLVTVGRR